MEKFGENFRGANNQVFCNLCFAHLDSLEMSFRCKEIRKKVNVVGNPSDIFEDSINKETIQTISNILIAREQAIEDKKKMNKC